MQLPPTQAEQLQSSVSFYDNSLLEIAPVWGYSTLRKKGDKMWSVFPTVSEVGFLEIPLISLYLLCFSN